MSFRFDLYMRYNLHCKSNDSKTSCSALTFTLAITCHNYRPYDIKNERWLPPAYSIKKPKTNTKMACVNRRVSHKPQTCTASVFIFVTLGFAYYSILNSFPFD